MKLGRQLQYLKVIILYFRIFKISIFRFVIEEKLTQYIKLIYNIPPSVFLKLAKN